MRFTYHEHWATRHHFDLRLEREDYVQSFAIPKGLPLKPHIRRLAIETEPHPFWILDFEGVIPEGYYGAGEMKIVDTGTYEILKETPKELKIKFNGSKIKGVYVFVKYGKGNRWLVFRKNSI